VLSLEPNGKPAPYSDRASDALLAFADLRQLRRPRRLGGRRAAARRRAAGRNPGVIIHGRLDLSCPFGAAWEFAWAWPGAELVAIDDAGHKGSAAMREQVRNAVARFAFM
jgi:proline iminopeptidase